MQDLNHDTQKIVCHVKECAYNQNNKYCTADAIHVGPQSATCTDDTVCETFVEENSYQ